MGDYAEDLLVWDENDSHMNNCLNCGNNLKGYHVCNQCGYDNE